MFCIVVEVFGNIKNWFSADNSVFMAGLWVVCEWFDWFVGGLAGLWIVLSFSANAYH